MNILSKYKGKISNSNREIHPFDLDLLAKEGKGFFSKGAKFVHHSDLHPNETAFYRLSESQSIIILLIFLAIFTAFAINWHTAFVATLAILTGLYFIDLLFNLFLIYRSFSKDPEIKVADSEINHIAEDTWPTYTVLCPLYKEWKVVPQFVNAISRIDYPKDKLQVMLLLEEDDEETINKVKELDLANYFEVVIVPHSVPKTKPKACNFGLMKARGEFIVIYDAEDIPDPKQLKKAILAFKKCDKRTVCIQCKLNFYNPHQNILTKMFTAEYSLWFDLVLTGLQSIHAPIPLGGTSNHFRTQDLRDLKGWDSFNVTEDCDLGIRLVRKGFRTAIVDSTTNEEANSDLKNWFWQRTRWVKGYIQTYLVHMREPGELINDWKEPHFITFQMVVGGKVLSMFINPLMWVTTITYFALRPYVGGFIESFFPSPVLYLAVVSLVFGNFLYMYYYMIGCAKRGYYDLIKYFFLVQIYWLMMSGAAWVAAYQFVKRPHHWSKTKHGLHLSSQKVLDQSSFIVGRKVTDFYPAIESNDIAG